MSAICIAYWHIESIKHEGKEYAFSPVCSFNEKRPIGGWVLMEVFDHAKRWAEWEQFCGEPTPKIPEAVEKELGKRTKKVRKIEPWPGED